MQHIYNHLDEHQKILDHVRMNMVDSIITVADMMVDLLSGRNKILVMGNGGSAADAQHFVAELVGRFQVDRPPLSAISLNTNSSVLTAIGNDYGFENVFSRQVDALAQSGDLVIGISTSGNSPNIMSALKMAVRVGASTLSLVGCDGGRIATVSDYCLCVPSHHTPVIQESHITIIHILCNLIEKKMFGVDHKPE